jgi:hypothetical protein
MTGLVETVLILGGLVLAGPVLSLLLPRLPVPGWVTRVPTAARYAAGIGVAFGVTFLVLMGGAALRLVWTYTSVGAVPDSVVVAILLAVVMPVFRVIVDSGVGAEPTAAPSSPLPPVISSLLGLLLMGTLLLAIPALALADDPNEKGTPASNPLGTGALVGGAAGGAAFAARRRPMDDAGKKSMPREGGEIRNKMGQGPHGPTPLR